VRAAPARRFDLNWPLVYASTVAAEAVLFFLALRQAPRFHALFSWWLRRDEAFESCLTVLVTGVLIVALVKKPPRWAGVLIASSDEEDKTRLSLWLLAAHGAFLAAFGLVWLWLIQRPPLASMQPPDQARFYLWIALARLAMLSFALGALSLVKTRLSMAAAFILPALLLSLVVSNLLSMFQLFLGPPLLQATLPAAHGLLRCVFDQPVYDPASHIIGSASFSVHLWGPCSGSEGIALMLLFCCLFWFVFRDRLSFPRTFVLLPLGLAAVWLANVLRVAALVCIGTWLSPERAMGGFHANAGWLVFAALAAALALAGAKSRALGGGFLAPVLSGNASVPYLAPFFVTLLGLFAAGPATGFDALYALRVVATAAALACFWRRYRDMGWTFSWAAAGAGALAFALWPIFGGWHDADAATTRIADGLHGLPAGWRIAWLALRSAGSIIVVPLAEELAFRGYLARWLVRSDFESVAVGAYSPFAFIASSLAFGLLHQRWILGSLAGMIFAAAAMRRNRLADAVVAHMAANALLTAYVLATGNWGLWN